MDQEAPRWENTQLQEMSSASAGFLGSKFGFRVPFRFPPGRRCDRRATPSSGSVGGLVDIHRQTILLSSGALDFSDLLVFRPMRGFGDLCARTLRSLWGVFGQGGGCSGQSSRPGGQAI